MECSEDDIYTITGYGEKRENMLLQWKRIKARDATYKLLVKVLRDLDNIATADRVKQLEEKRIAQGNNL